MSNEKPSRDLNLLAPFFEEIIEDVLKDCKDAGLKMAVFEAYRSPSRQDFLYQQGRTRPGKKVTYNKGWESWHQFSVSCDICFYEGGKWSWAGDWDKAHEIFHNHGLETLAFEKPHVQVSCGMKTEEALKIVREKGVLEVWSILERRFRHH